MSLTIIKKPEKSVHGHLSKWSAVHQPISFKVQRKDQAVSIKFMSGFGSNKVRIKVVGALPSSVAVGQRVYYSSPTQSYIVTITAINGNTLTTDGTTTGTIYGGFVNFLDAYKNYFVSTQIYTLNTSNALELLGTATTKVDSSGVSTVNVNAWLRTVAEFEDQFKYDQINKAINGEGGKFTVRFSEYYNGQPSPYGSTLGVDYWSNSAKQVGDLYGTNMGEYVPTYDATREEKAKFLSAFKKPTYFTGFPFSLSFIYSDNLLNYQVMRKESTKDINGTQVALTSDNLNASHRFFVNRLMLKEDYTSNINSLEVWLETGAVITFSPLDTNVYSDGTIFNPLLPIDGHKDLPTKV